jgi:hypothetical protein
VRFNCDYFKQRRAARWDAALEWSRTFAWLPVRLADGDCRWLETVEWRITAAQYFRDDQDIRRELYVKSGLFGSDWSEYREPQP